MIYQGFCGPSNPTQSVIADGEQLMNWYVERMQSQFSPTGAALYPVPGQTPRYMTTDVGARASGLFNGRFFWVYGAGLWEQLVDGTLTQRSVAFGPMAQDAYQATISYNSNVSTLGITSGGNWYNYDLATNTLTQVAALNGLANQGGYKDGFYLCLNRANSTVYVSALNDGTSWTTGLNFFKPSTASDPRMAMIVSNPAIYLIGQETTEAWFNEGSNTVQPFAPILSSFMNYGTPAPFAAGRIGDWIVWLAQQKEGGDQIVATKGFDAQPISNYAVSTALARMRRNSTLSDAEIFLYEEDGHTFADFNFWQARESWCVDLETAEWHQRGTWVANQNSFDAWHPRIHGYAFGKHWTGERATGYISESSVAIPTDADGLTGMRRQRIGPPLWAAHNQRLDVSRLQLRADVGLGNQAGQGSDPEVMLEWSPDGRTWGSQRQCSAGRIGRYDWHVFWTRNGSSTSLMVPRVTVTDPINAWRLSAAEIEGSGIYQIGRAA